MTTLDLCPVIVLAGGASRRMGSDKRQVHVEGIPMLQRTLERLIPALTLVVMDPRDPVELVMSDRVRVVTDTRPGEGPLAALEAGLIANRSSMAIVVAGDMPWLEPAVLRLLATRLAAHPDVDAACLADEDGPRPLPLALRSDPALSRVIGLLDGGERRLRALLVEAVVVQPSDWLPLDPERGTLRDIDTPADLATAR